MNNVTRNDTVSEERLKVYFFLFVLKWTVCTFSLTFTHLRPCQVLVLLTSWNPSVAIGAVEGHGFKDSSLPRTTNILSWKAAIAWLPCLFMPRSSTASQGWHRWNENMTAARRHGQHFAQLKTPALKHKKEEKKSMEHILPAYSVATQPA